MLTTFLSKSYAKVAANIGGFVSNPLALAVGSTFATDSLMFGAWVTHIPQIKTELGMNDAELGLALFGMPIGLLVMNPFSAWILGQFGLARTTTGATIATAISFALPAWMPNRWALMGALMLVGLSGALLNVAMNTCATNLERRDKIYIMSSCHGMWSLGGMVGSGISAAMIASGIGPRPQLSLLGIVIVLFAFWKLRPLIAQIPGAGERRVGKVAGPRLAFPDINLFWMIFIGFCAHMGEGVAFDWSAVYLRDVLLAPAEVAALAFTAFSLTMMAMRFIGDVLIPRFGERRLLYFNALFTAAALGIAILAPGPGLGVVGFLCLGAGVALGAPILYSAASRLPGMAPGAGLATFATFSFIGFLAGPPCIGFIGEAFGLRFGLALVAVLNLVALWPIKILRLG